MSASGSPLLAAWRQPSLCAGEAAPLQLVGEVRYFDKTVRQDNDPPSPNVSAKENGRQTRKTDFLSDR